MRLRLLQPVCAVAEPPKAVQFLSKYCRQLSHANRHIGNLASTRWFAKSQAHPATWGGGDNLRSGAMPPPGDRGPMRRPTTRASRLEASSTPSSRHTARQAGCRSFLPTRTEYNNAIAIARLGERGDVDLDLLCRPTTRASGSTTCGSPVRLVDAARTIFSAAKLTASPSGSLTASLCHYDCRSVQSGFSRRGPLHAWRRRHPHDWPLAVSTGFTLNWPTHRGKAKLE